MWLWGTQLGSGSAWISSARPGPARLGSAPLGSALGCLNLPRLGSAGLGSALFSLAQLSSAWLGLTGLVLAQGGKLDVKKRTLGPVRPFCSSAMPAHKRLPLDVKKESWGRAVGREKKILGMAWLGPAWPGLPQLWLGSARPGSGQLWLRLGLGLGSARLGSARPRLPQLASGQLRLGRVGIKRFVPIMNLGCSISN